MQHEKLYSQYETIKKSGGLLSGRKARKALDAANEYRETYRSEIAVYDNAEKYLKNALQQHFDPMKQPPIKKWKSEIVKLIAERKLVESDYFKLKDEVKEAERIRSRVYNITRQEQREHQPRRAQSVER